MKPFLLLLFTLSLAFSGCKKCWDCKIITTYKNGSTRQSNEVHICGKDNQGWVDGYLRGGYSKEDSSAVNYCD